MYKITLYLIIVFYSSSVFANDIQKEVNNVGVNIAGIKDLDKQKSLANKTLLINDAVVKNPELALLDQVRGINKYSPKIIGGNTVAFRQYPWQVALLKNTPPNRQFCGGSLIRKDWILTAAHCVDGGTLPSEILVLIGTDFLDQGGEKISVAKIIKHANYQDATLGYDIALLKLSKAVDETTINFISRGEENNLAFPGVLGWVTGWGITENGYPSLHLREVDIRLIANLECNSKRMYEGAVTGTMLCAGYRIGGKDSCQGDSGGPLIVPNQKGGFIQIGIVSWGDGCAEENRPGVYTRVAEIDTWITSKLNE